MTEFLIDPFLLERPSSDKWPDAVKSILAWYEESRSSDSRFLVSKKCMSGLYGGEIFPYMNNSELQSALKRDGEVFITVKDLCNAVNTLLRRAKWWEWDRALDCDGISVEPPEVLERQCTPQIQEDFSEWLLSHHLNHSGEAMMDNCYALASRSGSGLAEETPMLLSAHVLECDPPIAGTAFPTDFAAHFELRFKPPRVALDPSLLASDPKQAIHLGYEDLPKSDRDLYPLLDFAIGPDFVDSIVSLGLHRQPDILGVIVKQTVRIVSGQEARFRRMDIHPYRTGRGPADPQLNRPDGYRAFRCKLTARGAGYRLMYWKKEATYELWDIRTEAN